MTHKIYLDNAQIEKARRLLEADMIAYLGYEIHVIETDDPDGVYFRTCGIRAGDNSPENVEHFTKLCQARMLEVAKMFEG